MSDEARKVIDLSAQLALYGLAGPNLVRLTADYRDDVLLMQFVVLDGADEAEIDDYYNVSTEVLAQFVTANVREEFIRVETVGACKDIPSLPVQIYCRKLEN